jgi:hypothetical protein
MGFLRRSRVGGGHNGGRSQVNLNYLQTGGDYPFINHVKTGQYWSFITNPSPTAPVPPDSLDSDGYPTTITNGGVFTRFFIPPQSARSGAYKVDWLGIGTIYCPNATSPSGSKTSATAAGGSFTFTPTTTTMDMGISSIGATRITALRFYHVDDEALLTAGQVFGVKFKQRIAEARFAVLRFLNWQQGNTCASTTWWTRRAESYVYYSSAEYRPSIYCGTTSNSGNAYTAAAPAICSATGLAWDGDLRNGTTVSVMIDRSAFVGVTAAVSSAANTVLTTNTGTYDAQFNSVGESVVISGATGSWAGLNGTWTVSAASAGSLTVNFDSSALTPGALAGTVLVAHKLCSLNIGGTGAKNILNEYSNPLSFGGDSYPVGGSYKSLATLIYVAALQAWIKQGGDTASGNQGLNNGVPPELMLRLCAEVGAHPYFISPHHALDGDTDYMPSLAAYCRDNAPSWMIPRFEGPNELWNTFSGFYAAHFANARQAVINGSQVPGGVLTTTTYSASALVYPTDVDGAAWSSGTKYSKITFSTAGNSFIAGSRVAFGNAWGGISILNNNQGYVGGVNIGGDPNTITVTIPYSTSMPDGAPTSGTYTSGGTITPNVGDFHNWYGGAMSKLGQIVSAAYDADRSKYQVICGVQTANGATAGDRNNNIPRLDSTSFVRRVPPSGLTATPAKDWVTHLATAQYFTPSAHGTAAETGAGGYAEDYAGVAFTGSISGTTLSTSSPFGTIAAGQTIRGIGVDGAAVAPNTTITGGSGSSWTVNNSQTVASMPMVGGADLTAPIDYADTVNSGSGAYTLTKCAILYVNWKGWAQGFGIQKMCGYEGGFSPDISNSNGNSSVDRLRAASKYAPNLQTYLTTTFNDFIGLTDGTFTAEFPSSYLLSSNPYINGYTQQVWDVATDIYQTPNSPQWDAVVAFNHP